MNQPPDRTESAGPTRSGKNYGFSGQTASWRRPNGVAEGTWDYVTDRSIARHYDAFVADTPLCRVDEAILRKIFPPQKKDRNLDPQFSESTSKPVIVDFGCGTGRAAFPLARSGYRVVAIDLSQAMLETLQEKSRPNDITDPLDSPEITARQVFNTSFDSTPESSELRNGESPENLSSILPLRANLVQLNCIADDSADHGICLFSTMGMIQGRQNRGEFIRHAHRIIRPGGSFIVHVHHRWAALREHGGLSSLLKSGLQSWSQNAHEFGDQVYAYRGLEKMFMHRFAKGELLSDLRVAGWKVQKLWRIAIDGSSEAHRFGIPGGYIVQVTSSKEQRATS